MVVWPSPKPRPLLSPLATAALPLPWLWCAQGVVERSSWGRGEGVVCGKAVLAWQLIISCSLYPPAACGAPTSRLANLLTSAALDLSPQATARAAGNGVAIANSVATALSVGGGFATAYSQALAQAFSSNPAPLCAALATADATAIAAGRGSIATAAADALALCHNSEHMLTVHGVLSSRNRAQFVGVAQRDAALRHARVAVLDQLELISFHCCLTSCLPALPFPLHRPQAAGCRHHLSRCSGVQRPERRRPDPGRRRKRGWPDPG